MKVKKKTLLLLVPLEFGFNKVFANNAEMDGFDVYEIAGDIFGNFKYSSTFQKLTNTFRKIFLKDKDYKKKIKRQYYIDKLHNKFENSPSKTFDFALIIRPDLWDKDIVNVITDLAKRSVCYQWDGLMRYPLFLDYIKYFDDVYVFDRSDLSCHPKLKFSTNFWFNYLDRTIKPVAPNNRVLYVGTFQKNRVVEMQLFFSFLRKSQIDYDAFLYFDNKEDAKSYKDCRTFNILTHRLNYEEMVKLERDYSIILDFQNTLHSGLSFRHFEGLALERKIITNNKSVRNYDFYHANNTFILDEFNWNEIVEFIQLPFVKSNSNIEKKYSFSNWIRYVLDIKPYQEMG
ncbi:MAG: hypothetical protein DI598_11795 [Pseudopedobacter saltans]|uniref:Lipopolysaccharide biosynthesis protein n=1 Tax=Pseudopedobacter saltans TaxID=151895 RepID=A0A2W5GTN1_9SPHI|nr:MAG: hypothetical protein DI598_11795 [Pseudopedobacter saltans]